MENGRSRRARKRKLLKSSESHLPMAFDSSRETRSNKKYHSDAAAEAAVASLFNKRFEIVNAGFKLPEVKDMFTSEPWSIDALQILKKELNETKSQLNDYGLAEWSHHTRRRNKAGEVQRCLRCDIEPEFLTQAWCKFYENVSSFPLVAEKTIAEGKLDSVHLCEAPGAFVASLNHWLKLRAPQIRWNWLATTLNPHYEGNSLSRMVNDDRFIIHTLKNWFFGVDNTGNLMDLKNLDALVTRAGSDVMLVTADGSIDCLDTPAEQEEVVSQLHFCEALAALHLLQRGGNFLMKIFTIFEHQTINLVYLLSCCFEKIVVNKPVTSKEGNSEVYLVCIGFAGQDFIAPYKETLRRHYETPSNMAIFRRSDIPDIFIEQIVNCGEFFKAHQCEVILSNMRTFRNDVDEYHGDVDVKRIKRIVADKFIRIYELDPLPSEEMEIIGKHTLAQQDSAVIDFRTPPDSYNSRRKRENLNPKQRISMIAEDLKFLAVPDTEDTFRFNGIPDKLWISIGKPYKSIESSKFCAATILKMSNAALEIAHKIRFTARIPSLENIKEFIQETDDASKVLNFEYTGILNSHKLITEVCDAMLSLEKNQSLVLLGYSLLSQLSVGFLYLLAHTFDSLELKASEKMGCIITLKGNTMNEDVTQNLKEIAKASYEAKRKEEAILSVFPISTLCDSIFYQHIIRINHWIIKHYVCYMANNFEE